MNRNRVRRRTGEIEDGDHESDRSVSGRERSPRGRPVGLPAGSHQVPMDTSPAGPNFYSATRNDTTYNAQYNNYRVQIAKYYAFAKFDWLRG